jgi:hypothetical protein
MILILLCPLVVLVCLLSEDRQTAMIIAGAILAIINAIFCVLGSTASKAAQEEEDNDDNVSLVSPKGISFLLPKKSVIEAIWSTLVAFGYGAAMTYICHAQTFEAFRQPQDVGSVAQVIIFTGLSGYSLFSHRCPESAIYRDNELEFQYGSNHYQRQLYFIALGVVMLFCENIEIDKDIGFWWTMVPVIYFLQALGLLSHPVVTMAYLVEQLSIHVLGGSPRATDLRIYLFFLVNFGFVVLIHFTNSDTKPLLFVALSFIGSHNLFSSLGLIKPFRGKNKRLQDQDKYADIVFEGKGSSETEDNGKS